MATVTYMARERYSKRDIARVIEEKVRKEIAIETGRAATDRERERQMTETQAREG